MRRTFFAPVFALFTLIAGLLVVTADPVRAGTIGPEPEPEFTPGAVLYSVDTGLILLLPSGISLEDLGKLPLPPDVALVDLDDLTHGSSDAFALTGICASDPACNAKILGSGPSGRQSLVDALLSTYSFDGFVEPPSQPVPEPGTAALFALGLGALAFAGRSRS